MAHLMSSTQTLVENDRQRREELAAKAGVEALDDVVMPGNDLPHEDSPPLPEGAEPIDDVEMPALPAIGTPVRYRARNGFMRRRQVEFPAFVIGYDRDGTTVHLYVILDQDDTAYEENVRPYSEDDPSHTFALVGDGAALEEIGRLRADVEHLRAVVLGEYVDPPKSVMDHLADFEQRLNAMSAPKGKNRG